MKTESPFTWKATYILITQIRHKTPSLKGDAFKHIPRTSTVARFCRVSSSVRRLKRRRHASSKRLSTKCSDPHIPTQLGLPTAFLWKDFPPCAAQPQNGFASLGSARTVSCQKHSRTRPRVTTWRKTMRVDCKGKKKKWNLQRKNRLFAQKKLFKCRTLHS